MSNYTSQNKRVAALLASAERLGLDASEMAAVPGAWIITLDDLGNELWVYPMGQGARVKHYSLTGKVTACTQWMAHPIMSDAARAIARRAASKEN